MDAENHIYIHHRFQPDICVCYCVPIYRYSQSRSAIVSEWLRHLVLVDPLSLVLFCWPLRVSVAVRDAAYAVELHSK